MRQKVHYEYACDRCDHYSIVLETVGKVKFKDLVSKATAVGWKIDTENRLICSSCIELATGEVFEQKSSILGSSSKSYVWLTVFVTLSILVLVFVNKNNINLGAKVVKTLPSENILAEEIGIEPELLAQIEKDPEKFVERQEAIPENDEPLFDANKLALIPAKTEASIQKEITTQQEEQDIIYNNKTHLEKPSSPVKKVERNIPEEDSQPPKKTPIYHGNFVIFTGVVHSNLSRSARKAGLKFGHVKKLISIFSYSINFRRLARGDSYTVVFDKDDFEQNGNFAKILASEFKSRGKIYQRFYFTNNKGKSSYYLLSSKGPSKTITKVEGSSEDGFIRYPLNHTRVSSSYNLRRRHPITGKIRPHRGTDFAAPRNTKVWATANGVVKAVGWQKGFGKVVILSHHSGKYNTVYAHLRKFARGIKKGRRVKRKQTIGYVGSTGASTGYHLHYEFRVKGNAVNPLRVRLPKVGKVVKIKITDPIEQKKFKQLATQMAGELRFARVKIGSL